ncbi:MAG: TraR/DksA C4-type zinc finger protein [Pseudomonadota bacterium]
MLSEAEIEAFRARLLAMQTELEDLRQISQGETEPVILDQQSVGRLSRMDAMQRQAMGAEQGRRRGHDLQRIAAALKRIEEEEFGACVECGDDIAKGRLNVDPAAALCIRCVPN